MHQLTIPALPWVRDDLRRRAEEWIVKNPTVYALFLRFAREKLARNRRFGAKELAERVRWEIDLLWADSEFKVNNNYTAYIARRLVVDEPRLLPLLRFRRTQGWAIHALIRRLQTPSRR